ncbi:hypothetical protein CUMW_276780, partial [Citrus unshiu]
GTAFLAVQPSEALHLTFTSLIFLGVCLLACWHWFWQTNQCHYISRKWHRQKTEERSTLASKYVLPLVSYPLIFSITAPKRSRAAGAGESPWQSAAAPASILTIGALFLPETPNSVIQRSNDHQKAERMLQRVRGTADVQAELDDLIRAGSISKTINHPFKKIIERKYRSQLVMAILIPFFQQVTGINVISFYAPVLFRTIKLSESTSLLMSAIVTGGVGTISTILSMILADRLGRKVLFLVGGIQMLVSQVMIGSIMAAQLGDHGGFSTGYAYLILVLVCVYTTGFAYSWGPLGWLVPSEIFPLEIRSAAQSITVAVGLLFTFLVAQTFLAMLCHFKAGIFFFFGGWVAFMTTFVHFFLPETKNLPIEQMDKLWAEHWFWRRIVGEGVEDSKIQEAL